MDDNRVFARINARFPLKFLDPVSGREGSADTVDISANGVGFITNEYLDIRTALEMWLQIPDQHEPLYLRGRVVWSGNQAEAGRVGVRLDRAELMGLARVLWLQKRGS